MQQQHHHHYPGSTGATLALSVSVSGLAVARSLRWAPLRLVLADPSGPVVAARAAAAIRGGLGACQDDGDDDDEPSSTEPAAAMGRPTLPFVAPLLVSDPDPGPAAAVSAVRPPLVFRLVLHATSATVATVTVARDILLRDIHATPSRTIAYPFVAVTATTTSGTAADSLMLHIHSEPPAGGSTEGAPQQQHLPKQRRLPLRPPPPARPSPQQQPGPVTTRPGAPWHGNISFSLGARGLLNTSAFRSQAHGPTPLVLNVYHASTVAESDTWIPVYRSKFQSVPEISRPCFAHTSVPDQRARDIPLRIEVVTYGAASMPASSADGVSQASASFTLGSSRPGTVAGYADVTLSALQNLPPGESLGLRTLSGNRGAGFINVRSAVAPGISADDRASHFVLDTFVYVSRAARRGELDRDRDQQREHGDGPPALAVSFEHKQDVVCAEMLRPRARSILGEQPRSLPNQQQPPATPLSENPARRFSMFVRPKSPFFRRLSSRGRSDIGSKYLCKQLWLRRQSAS